MSDPPPAPPRASEAWETGDNNTVIATPDEVTRVRAQFPLEELFVRHGGLVEHEHPEMMRPYCVGNSAACQEPNDRAATRGDQGPGCGSCRRPRPGAAGSFWVFWVPWFRQ